MIEQEKGSKFKMEISIKEFGIRFNDEYILETNSYRKYLLLEKENIDYSGWAYLPLKCDANFFENIKIAAEEIKKKCTLLIVVGIGGSYLGANAVISALNSRTKSNTEIIFAGFDMSSVYLKKVLERIEKESACICVISKSGTTTEPLLSYAVIKDKLIEKYGKEEAERRTYIITDKSKGLLRQEAIANGNTTFEIPENIGGRYSVLTPVGLLPIAVAGYDIEALLQGAKDMALSEEWEDKLLEYAVYRVELQRRGKSIEIFEYFESSLHYFGEWLKQLFCESEGKEGKGAFAATLCFTRDLHSVGQLLQQGNQIFYETMIIIKESNYDFKIPEAAGELYAGNSLNDINTCAVEGVIAAHRNIGIPIITIEIPELDEYNLGQLIYFFEMSCAISAHLIGVNPFDQPGVEAYKSEMKKQVEKLNQKR